MTAKVQFETLGDVTRTHALRYGSKAALKFDGRTTSYAELDRLSNRVANRLAEGVARGSRVAWLSKNNDLYYVLLLGAAKAGVTLVPLNWRLAAPEIRWIIADAQPDMVIVADSEAPLRGHPPRDSP